MHIQSYVLSAHFDEMDTHHLQVRFGDIVLMTVCEPAGPGDGSSFGVWDGDGTNDDDSDADPVLIYYTRDFPDVNACWKAAVRSAYFFAAEKWHFIA